MKLFEAIVFLSFVGGVMGISCYVCSTGQAGCDDPFKPSDALKRNCTSDYNACYKVKGEVLGITVVERQCEKKSQCLKENGCFTVEGQGNSATGCCCTGDYCNGTGSLGVMSVMVSVILGLLATVIAP
ncbi:uncharacterized protein LOC110977107 [Acanthaster planci]|uniref:Uncharacterized protein LOC110977107 n=1 Tax=Acanthaster planci TaxID=133434 RepID=A0A8B7Y0E1_ACAPL|nr:uncharacterized protein LOC110977107 [Acanthaster planci]XP_022086628.1 uncharacterized protein LOC110977107 [Acanthaster planci]XP_022086629.1 uncharacterized protein LOC110977107 [Acanthaster planci]